jgi:hypothetical protein
MLRFSLAGDQGLEVTAAGYPASQPRHPATGRLEAMKLTGKSGVSCDAGTG